MSTESDAQAASRDDDPSAPSSSTSSSPPLSSSESSPSASDSSPDVEPFSNLMETLLSNLIGLRAKLDDNSKTTSSLLSKASALRKQIKDKQTGPESPSITVSVPEDPPLVHPSHASSPSLPPLRSSPLSLRKAVLPPTPTSPRSPQAQAEPHPPFSDASLHAIHPPSSTSHGTGKYQSGEALPHPTHEERERELLSVIAYLEVENQSLSDAAEESFATLELAMSRFRAESAAVQIHKADATHFKAMFEREKQENESLRLENVALKQKLEHAIAVMQIASQEDDQVANAEEAFAAQLEMENENLRQLLQISEKMNPPS